MKEKHGREMEIGKRKREKKREERERWSLLPSPLPSSRSPEETPTTQPRAPLSLPAPRDPAAMMLAPL